MNGAPATLEHPWLLVLGWLVLLTLCATVIPGLALTAWRLMRPAASAPRQYRAAVVAFSAACVLALVGVPPLLLVAPAMRVASPAAGATAAASPASPAARGAEPAGGKAVTPVTPTPARAAPSTPALPPATLGLLSVAWLAGATLLLARFVVGLGAATRLRGRATLVDPSPLLETFEGLSAGAQVGHTRLAVSTEIDAPVAVGVRTPTVLLPAHLVELMPEEGLASILAHELAHVARRDYAHNLAQSACEAVLWHCPAIWWLGGRVRETREFCCDDASVAVAGDRARYVEALTLVARLGTIQHARPAVGMAGPRLITRVRRLLEGEPTMSMPIVRASLVAAAIVVVTAAMPPLFSVASGHLSARLLAAGRGLEGGAVPYGFPLRQDGSALRIARVSSSETNVCGTFEVRNASTVPIERVRFVGILSFKAAAKRPVQVFESDWVSQPLPPGATARLNAGLVDVDLAWREGRGEHVQAFCAVREIAYANGATWGVIPNPNAIHGSDALEQSRPTLPRAFVGQTHLLATSHMSVCVDDKGAEYSGGAQIAIREEPGKAARCTVDGRWIEVEARTGEPVAAVERLVVTLDVTVEGLPSTLALKSTVGAVATLHLAGGRTWGFVPTVAANGDVAIALHDMSATPHRLLATRAVAPGGTARFDEASPAVSVRLARD